MSEVEGLFHSGKGNQIRQPVREVLNQMDSWNHWPSPAPKKEPLKPKEDAGKSGKAEATNDDPGAFATNDEDDDGDDGNTTADGSVAFVNGP